MVQNPFKNWKIYIRGVITAAFIFVVGGYLLPVVNSLFKFIQPYKILITGLTPHVLIAYGIAAVIADAINESILKM